MGARDRRVVFPFFSNTTDSPFHSLKGEQMPAIRAVQGDCETVYVYTKENLWYL